MYEIILPSPNAAHQLKEYLSRRGESCLESFHLMLAHFGNCGMRTSLADNLNLTGTARHNLTIRHKRLLVSVSMTPENTAERRKIPAAFESVVGFFNHSELDYINRIAIQAGMTHHDIPFKNVEPLPPDNGERFFSECLVWMKDAKPRYDVNCRCLCDVCGVVAKAPPQMDSTNASLHPPTTRNCDKGGEAAAVSPTAATAENVVRPNHNITNVLATGQSIGNSMQQHHNQFHHQQQQQQQQQSNPTEVHQWCQPHQQPYMMYYPPMTNQLTPFPPWTMPTHVQAVATVSYCCGRYRSWHNRAGRRGRPPHDDYCHRQQQQQQYRQGNNERKIDYNSSWRVI